MRHKTLHLGSEVGKRVFKYLIIRLEKAIIFSSHMAIPCWGCWRLISFPHSILLFLPPSPAVPSTSSSSNLRCTPSDKVPAQHPLINITLAGLGRKINPQTFLVLDCQRIIIAAASVVVCENYWRGKNIFIKMNTIITKHGTPPHSMWRVDTFTAILKSNRGHITMCLTP